MSLSIISNKCFSRICQNLKRHDIDHSIFTLPENSNSEQISYINSVLYKVFPIFVTSKSLKDSNIEAWDKLATSITSGLAQKDLSNIQFNIGIGGSEILPSIRLANAIIYPLEVLMHLAKVLGYNEEKLPTVRIFFAINLANAVNGFEIEKMRSIAEQSISWLQERLSHIGFMENFIFEIDNINDLHLAKSFKPELKEHISNMQDAINAIGKRRKVALDNIIDYLIAHPFQLGMLSSRKNGCSQHDIKIIISALNEKLFLNFMRNISQDQNIENADIYKAPAIVMHARYWQSPPYYPKQGEKIIFQKDGTLYNEIDPVHKSNFSTDINLIKESALFDIAS